MEALENDLETADLNMDNVVDENELAVYRFYRDIGPCRYEPMLIPSVCNRVLNRHRQAGVFADSIDTAAILNEYDANQDGVLQDGTSVTCRGPSSKGLKHLLVDEMELLRRRVSYEKQVRFLDRDCFLVLVDEGPISRDTQGLDVMERAMTPFVSGVVGAADETRTDEEVAVIERSACPATPSRMPPAPAAARCAT